MNIRITPTVGRVMLFWPSAASPIPRAPGEPLAALVAAVIGGGEFVNLAVFDHTGALWPRQDVRVVQEGEVPAFGDEHATWMPYQIEQAREAVTTPAERALTWPPIGTIPMAGQQGDLPESSVDPLAGAGAPQDTGSFADPVDAGAGGPRIGDPPAGDEKLPVGEVVEAKLQGSDPT